MKVDNAVISFFWNNFDFFIRFGYCKLGPLSKLLNKLLFWKLYSSDFKKLDMVFEDSFNILRENNVPIEGKTILEVGPGNSYITGYNFLMNGARKIIFVDKFPRIIKTKKQKELFEEELEYISKKYEREPFFINNGEIDPEFIVFVNKDLTEANIESVDLIFTNSVLEHIKQIEENIMTMSKVLNDGGYMLHNIDLRDHYNFNRPFLFYKYSDWIWNNLLTKEGISYTNRLRYDDFINLFKKYGFKTIYEKTERCDLSETKLSSRFKYKDKEDLEITHLTILSKKVG